MRKSIITTVGTAIVLTFSGCATNHSAEGAAAGGLAGAAVSIISGGDVSEGILVGAAAGAAAGYFIDKDNDCSGYDDQNRLDDDCYGRRGYPDRRPR